MPQQSPDLSAQITALFPGIDVVSAKLLMRAGRLGRLVEVYRGRTASLDSGLDPTSQIVLGALLMLGSPHRLSPTFLSKYVVQTSGGMTKTLRRLEKDGLVTRVPDERDGRISYVQLTEAGKVFTTQFLSGTLQEWQDALRIRGVNAEEALATVSQLLDTLEVLTGARMGRELGV
jgi:DNA-binding MarR family transcriptional regulator